MKFTKLIKKILNIKTSDIITLPHENKECPECRKVKTNVKATVRKKADIKKAAVRKLFTSLKPKKDDAGKKILLKIILWPVAIIFGLFIITALIYFFNLDMKAMSLVEPLLQKHYDKMPRKQYI